MCLFFFFFFKQKTAYEMRISDWSSDVCSSDLLLLSRTLLRFDHHVEDAFGHAGVRRVQQRRDVEACAHDRAFVRERLEAEFAVRRADAGGVDATERQIALREVHNELVYSGATGRRALWHALDEIGRAHV